MSLTIIDHAVSATISEVGGELHKNSASVTLTLPDAKIGMHVKFCRAVDSNISIQAGLGDTIAGSEVGKVFENVTGGEVGKVCRLKCVVAGEWVLDGDFTGTWVVNNT